MLLSRVVEEDESNQKGKNLATLARRSTWTIQEMQSLQSLADLQSAFYFFYAKQTR